MITDQILKYLGISPDSYYDNLFIVFPRETVITAIDLWIEANAIKGISSRPVGEYVIIQASEEGKETLTSNHINAMVNMGAILHSEHVCIGVEVNTTALDNVIPESYDSPYADIYDGEEFVRRKTVDELMITVRGTEGKSLVLCAEIKEDGNASGLQMDELERFRVQFPTFQVFSKKQRIAWETNNIIGE